MENTPPEQATGHGLDEHSWNLELLISGAAIVLATYLPEAVEDYFYYYLHYMPFEFSGEFHTLPVMAYSFFKVVAWLLIIAFVIHLIMRAFWVSLVGLHEVYPHGIRYENMPNVTEEVKRFQERKFGRLDAYMTRLDRLCNQIFAFAFLLALSGVGIGVAYHLLFGFYQIFESYLGDWFWYTMFFLIVGLSVGLIGVTVYLKKRPQANSRLSDASAQVGYFLGSITMPLVYRPLTYLSMAFATNVPRTRYYAAFLTIMIGFMVTVMLVFTNKLSDMRGRHILEPRQYFSSGAPEFELSPDRYDNQRSSPRRIPLVSLPSEIVEGPMLPVFVLYPLMIDERMAAAGIAYVKADKNLPRERRLFVQDSANMAGLTRFFQLRLNDSVVTNPGWMYHQKPNSINKGLVAYLPTAPLKPGRNTVSVYIPSEEKPDSLERYGLVPFWFSPKD